MNENKKILSPKIDVIFQALFGEQGSERITKAFLERILDIKIKSIELNQNPILRREKVDGKLGVLDVIAKINDNQNIDIEMQISTQENIKDRILYYWSRLYIRSIKKKENYDTLEKSIVILITEEKIAGLEELECHTDWRIIEKKNKEVILTDKLEIHIIELEKLNDYIDSMNTNLIDWLTFLQDPESERVMKSMENNKELKEAKEKLEQISEDEKMQQLAWWREKWVYEENGRKRREKEIKAGEKRVKIGEEKLKVGEERLKANEERLKANEERLNKERKQIQEEKAKIQTERKQIIQKLFDAGMTKEQVIEITGFSKEEIENI